MITDIFTIKFFYNNIENITFISDILETDTQKTITFGYDGLYRLTTASTTDAQSNPFSQSYSYNAIGNILNKSDKGNYTYAGTNYANPHAVTDINGTTYVYDNNGNITGSGSDTFVWDWKNRLISSVVVVNLNYCGHD